MVDCLTRNVVFLDSEVRRHYEYFEGRILLDGMYARIQTETIVKDSTVLKEKVNKMYTKLKEIIVQTNENFKQQEIFEEKTEKNFKIAEKAIKSHSTFLNAIDARGVGGCYSVCGRVDDELFVCSTTRR